MAISTFTQNLDDYYASTWARRKPGTSDAIHKSNPLLAKLFQKCGIKASSGPAIEVTVRTQKNTSIQGIGRGGTVTIADVQPHEVCRYEWKQITGHIVRDIVDEMENTGSERIIDQTRAKQDGFIKDFQEKLHEVIFADTVAGSLYPLGLQVLVDDTPTITRVVGGQDQGDASKAWHRPQVTANVGSAYSYLSPAMRAMRNTLSEIDSVADLIVTTSAIVTAYENCGDDIVRVRPGDHLDFGFPAVLFDGVPMTFSRFCPTGFLYMLNTDELAIESNSGVDLVPSGDWIQPPTQPTVRLQHYLWRGCFYAKARRGLAVLTGITTT